MGFLTKKDDSKKYPNEGSVTKELEMFPNIPTLPPTDSAKKDLLQIAPGDQTFGNKCEKDRSKWFCRYR
jgi:hypothetical protein